jgi:hypothetical protein
MKSRNILKKGDENGWVRPPAANRSRDGTLPNLIIIGAMKGGTTSLHYYLSLHPQISMSREKELNFFVRECNWDKGVEWYKSNFTGRAQVYGEASPLYTNYPTFRGVPERMHSVVPQAKLIYILRDPVERLVSHYAHYYAEGRETRPIAEALADFSCPYICRSQYAMQLELYLEYYPPSSILIITQEDLLRRRRATLREVFRFLNVDDSFHSLRFAITKHKTRDKRRLSRTGELLTRMPGLVTLKRLAPDVHWHLERWLCFPFSHKVERPVLGEPLRQALIDYLRGDVNRLRAYSGRDYGDWCV